MRKPILHHRRISEFLIDELKFYARHLQSLIVYTILPDHIHLMVEIERMENLSSFLRDFKKYTSDELRKRLRSGGSSDPHNEVIEEGRSDDRPLHSIV